MRPQEYGEKVFQKELDSFEAKGTGIREFAAAVIAYMPDYFMEPSEDGSDNQIVSHTRSCLALANALFELDFFRTRFQAAERDCIRAALLLHDAMLYGDGSARKPLHEHPELMYVYLCNEKFDALLPSFVRTDIARLVRVHSGQWNAQKGCYNLKKPKTEMEFFTHMCVYLASKKECTVELPVTKDFYRKVFEKQSKCAKPEAAQPNTGAQAFERIVHQMVDGKAWDGFVRNSGSGPYAVIAGQYVPVAEDLLQAFFIVGQERNQKRKLA